ncbi:hypothetical protein KAFR_0C04590 [Kazachstania africana CBS 2517]|uniref:Protein kinase domain-containing protein n=1 Tax=Kazachstania africana (strain ATCC 22294 / BCRC 22015 / CBS 2517 / CECT 1963 / NBRC 1671 / NRRL Y-8276) TaxID=1071382 RepID=H2ASV0_KAZAF|nr:hypothetical protein KAFR_0C04590 [Kazachstania africana CBS 2517]CCF57450.1 hypothetical protein KAFR_0C04590 [Kazachstania africana CBS 2517]
MSNQDYFDLHDKEELLDGITPQRLTSNEAIVGAELPTSRSATVTVSSLPMHESDYPTKNSSESVLAQDNPPGERPSLVEYDTKILGGTTVTDFKTVSKIKEPDINVDNAKNNAIITPNLTISPSSNNRSRSKSVVYRNEYFSNEKSYLEKMKKKMIYDEYYTKGIISSLILNDEVDPEIEKSEVDLNLNDLKIDLGDSNKNNFLHKLGSLDPKSNYFKLLLTKLKAKNKDDPKDIDHILEDVFEHSDIIERLEWQTMLSKVLNGDIIKSERTKLDEEERDRDTNRLLDQYSEDIWLELRAWMNGRTVEDQKDSFSLLRESSDIVFDEIMRFKADPNLRQEEAESEVENLLNNYYKVMNFWPNLKHLISQKPITGTTEFVNRVETLTSWLNSRTNLKYEIDLLQDWVGVSDLDFITNTSATDENKIAFKKFAEKIMQEKDIETIFQKKIFFPLAPWILKAKLSYLKYMNVASEMNLKHSDTDLVVLLLFPIKLLEEIIKVRLLYAKKLQNPTMMMIDQMIDDFSAYVKLSAQLKATLIDYCKRWYLDIELNDSFDQIVVHGIRFLFKLLHLKVIDGSSKSFKTYKEPEVLVTYWEALKNTGHYIAGAGKEIAFGFSKLTATLLQRLNEDIGELHDSTTSLRGNLDGEKWLLQTLENLGSLKRKLNRFSNLLSKAFQNTVTYTVNDCASLLENLRNTGHFLIYSGSRLERNGVYLIASPNLIGIDDDELLRILKNAEIGCDIIPKIEIKSSLSIYGIMDVMENPNTKLVQKTSPEGVPYHEIVQEDVTSEDANLTKVHDLSAHTSRTYSSGNILTVPRRAFKLTKSGSYYNGNKYQTFHTESEKEILELEAKVDSLGYILLLSTGQPIIWEGSVHNVVAKSIDFGEILKSAKPNTLTLFNQGSSYSLDYRNDTLKNLAGNSISYVLRSCSIGSIENILQRINKTYFNCTCDVLTNYTKVVTRFKESHDPGNLINGLFLFTRDFGRNFLRTSNSTYQTKSAVILLMVKMSIRWLSFLAEECDPNDQRTFKWCVTAMEFAMQMISGLNILALNKSQFHELKEKISVCMSLLVSHFDVMGARSSDMQKLSKPSRLNMDIIEDFDVDAMLAINSRLRLNSIAKLEEKMTHNLVKVGKVLDDTEKSNKFISSLASSISNVSIRWQKRKYIGGGTFGAVFSAVNLDNGEILAVKEIKIQDNKSMEKFFPLIKDEMNVLEMLNHPNVVQYYGVEVHRDRVNIFMEYCEGGSLATLLEHGRIEDELVTQMYTLQLLEGLAYLHESGIIHRDIKPENILLDYNGIIKYVDFGASKRAVKNSTRWAASIGKGSISSHSSSEGDSNSGKLQDLIGTPMYMAPEAITGSTTEGRFGSSDIWSLGCVTLEMITGKRPWYNLDNEWAILYHVVAGQSPRFPNKNKVSSAGRKFLKRCLVHSASKRATAFELLMEPWIVEIRELAFGDSNRTDSNKSVNNNLSSF